MTKIVSKNLPHGKIPFEDISNPQTKRSVMLINENTTELKRQLDELQKAVVELQRR